MGAFGAALVACGFAACMGSASTTGPQIAPPAGDAEQVLDRAPLRLEIPVGPDVARAIMSEPVPTIRLTLEGVRAEGESSGLRVFVAAKDTDPSVDSVNFVGSVAFGHTGPFEQAPTDSFLLNIGPALSRLPPQSRLIDGKRLAVTLAPRLQERTAPTVIHIKRVTIAVPKPATSPKQ